MRQICILKFDWNYEFWTFSISRHCQITSKERHHNDCEKEFYLELNNFSFSIQCEKFHASEYLLFSRPIYDLWKVFEIIVSTMKDTNKVLKGMKEIYFFLSVLKRQQIISLLAEMGVLKTSKYAPTYFLNKVNVSPQFFLPLKKFPCKKSKFCFVYVIIM